MTPKFILGLTTTPGSDWREKIEETKRLNISEMALFTTFLNLKERTEVYKLLKSSPIVSIPHAHLRDDQEPWELDLLFDKYGTRLFNMHPNNAGEAAFLGKFADYEQYMYFENQEELTDQYKRLIDISAGMCIDLAHLHDYGHLRKVDSYKAIKGLMTSHKIGCAHVSAIRPELTLDKKDGLYYHAWHTAADVHELDYVKEYIDILPPIVSIELENTFLEQLEFKKYLEEMVENHRISEPKA